MTTKIIVITGTSGEGSAEVVIKTDGEEKSYTKNIPPEECGKIRKYLLDLINNI